MDDTAELTTGTPEPMTGMPDQIEEIRQLLEKADPDFSERRSNPRFAYPMVQAMAPCSQDGSAGSKFRLARCYDISQNGISFLWPSRPDFTSLIVRLASPRGSIHVEARVVRCRSLAELNNEFLVCCQFVKKI